MNGIADAGAQEPKGTRRNPGTCKQMWQLQRCLQVLQDASTPQPKNVLYVWLRRSFQLVQMTARILVLLSIQAWRFFQVKLTVVAVLLKDCSRNECWEFEQAKNAVVTVVLGRFRLPNRFTWGDSDCSQVRRHVKVWRQNLHGVWSCWRTWWSELSGTILIAEGLLVLILVVRDSQSVASERYSQRNSHLILLESTLLMKSCIASFKSCHRLQGCHSWVPHFDYRTRGGTGLKLLPSRTRWFTKFRV